MRFDVVPVPFPFDDHTGQKVRPAVCLTNPIGTRRHTVLAFITSVVPAQLETTDILLDPTIPGGARSGLRVQSVLRLHRIITVSTSIILRRLGVLDPTIQTLVQQQLRTLFSL
jgi:mRNA interferase MazF